MKIHLKLIAGIAALGSVATVSTVSAQQAFTKPVGYRTETITAGVFNLISSELGNAVAAAGELTAVAGAKATDDNADFTTSLPTDAGQTYVMQITGGNQAGLVSEVASVDDANNVTAADDLGAAGVAAGATYEIRRAKTLSDLFGAANEAGLTSGAEGTADIIWLPDGAGGFVRYYYSQSFLGAGWRAVGDAVTDQKNVPIVYTDAFFIQSRAAANKDIVLVGHVPTAPATVPLLKGFNFSSRIVPVGQTLATAALEGQVLGGAEGTADIIWVADGQGGYARYYFSESFLGNGWRAVGDAVTDQKDKALSSGIIIQRRGDPKNVTIGVPAFYADL